MVQKLLYKGLLSLSLLLCGGCSEANQDHDIANVSGKKNVVPVVIIGSGPAGLGAALSAAGDKKYPLIIAGYDEGGLLTKTHEVANWLGVPAVPGVDAIKMATDQALRDGARFLRDNVAGVDFSSWPYKISTNGGLTIHALTLVIATGSTPKYLGIPGEQENFGSGVSTCALCDARFYKNKVVVVVGGGDSAVEEAIQLSGYAREVHVLVRKDKMRASASSQGLLAKRPSVTVHYNTIVDEVRSNDEGVTGVLVRDIITGDQYEMPTSGVFLAVGHNPNTELFKKNIELDDQGYIVLQGRTQKTSLPGVFAAGDVSDRFYRQATYAGGCGVAAGIDASRYLDEIGFNAQFVRKIMDKNNQNELNEALCES